MVEPRVRRLDRRGGETITAVRPHRPRLLIAAGAGACALALAAYPAVLASDRRPLTAALGAGGLILVLAALAAGSKAAIPWGILALGCEYAVALVARGGGLDPAAPVVAALLFACAELADWSADAPRGAVWERAPALARLRALALATAAGAAGAAVVTVAADVATAGSGVAATVVGTACAVAAVGVLALLARRADAPRSR